MTLATLHHHIDLASIGFGLLVAAIVYLVVEWVGGLIGFPRAQAVAAILAVLVFLAYAF